MSAPRPLHRRRTFLETFGRASDTVSRACRQAGRTTTTVRLLRFARNDGFLETVPYILYFCHLPSDAATLTLP